MNILFICTHNRCRSILAEAIARDAINKLNLADRFQVASAGSSPAGQVYPGTLEFLVSENISTEGLKSQGWDDESLFAATENSEKAKADVVITVCDNAAGEACPLWLGKAEKLHWGLPDPSKLDDRDEQVALFSQVANELRQRISALINAA